MYDRIIKVIVGPEGATREFQVYRGLICHHSEYFDRMLNGSFREAQSESLRLEEVQVEMFHHFYDWMNTGAFDIDGYTKDEIRSKTSLPEVIAKLYIFADYHVVHSLKNAALDCMYLLMESEQLVPANNSPLIYSNTTGSDPLRQLLVDVAVRHWPCDINKGKLDNYDKEFLVDYVLKLKELEAAPGVLNLNRTKQVKAIRPNFCEWYHVHPNVKGTPRDVGAST